MLAPVPQDLCWQVVYGKSPFQVRHSYERQAGKDKTEGNILETLAELRNSECLKYKFGL